MTVTKIGTIVMLLAMIAVVTVMVTLEITEAITEAITVAVATERGNRKERNGESIQTQEWLTCCDANENRAARIRTAEAAPRNRKKGNMRDARSLGARAPRTRTRQESKGTIRIRSTS